ncbi:GumC family protein [Haloferula sp.]|uniref:GumC family protein n=1 Tax=Haloferula sp. TaxID=2497595 RepID=UPI00329BFD89
MKSKASKEAKPAPNGFGIRDIILVVFRHKWKILLLGILGVAAAASVHLMRTPAYASSSKLLVKYVLVHNEVDAFESESTPGTRGGGPIIDAEIEILTSEDLAMEVGEAVGVDAIVADIGRPPTPIDAANTIIGGLEVGAKRDSNVITVTYKGADPDVTRSVLRELLRRYAEMHLLIHRSKGALKKITADAEEARRRYEAATQELDKLKSGAGILSLSASGEALDAQRGSARNKLLDAETDLVGQQARVAALEAIMGGDDGGEEDAPLQAKRADPVVIAEYQDLSKRIANTRQDRMERLKKFKASDRVALHLEGQIRQLVDQRASLLKANPGLLMQAGPAGGPGPAGPDLVSEQTLLVGLEAQVDKLQAALEKLDREFAVLSGSSSKIEDLERVKKVEGERLSYLEKRLEKFEVDDALNAKNLPNISIIQKPSPPKEVYDATTKKIVLGLAASGIALGLGLAFLIDLVLDRRVKAPLEIQTRLQVPLLMSIPHVRPKLRGNQMLIEDREVARIAGGDDYAGASVSGSGRLSEINGSNDGFILPYAEAIRNRIIFNFELNKINHKPKLIALTGLSEGAGTSTVAAGLAKAFSQADNVKVLLVDLNKRSKEEVAKLERRDHHSLDGALKVARHTQFKNGGPSLHYARIPEQTNGDKSFTPLHLHGMLPDFRASDFDYIIFDMPQVGPTSPTLAMAGLMDKVLLVLDGDNTDREELQWGYSELTRGQADVSCVFNKTRDVGPRWLVGES